MEVKQIEKYLQAYLHDVIIPEVNQELSSVEDEPITIKIHKVTYGEKDPHRLNFFLDLEPDWSQGSIVHRINSDLSRFVQMLGINKNLHIYWNKRPLY